MRHNIKRRILILFRKIKSCSHNFIRDQETDWHHKCKEEFIITRERIIRYANFVKLNERAKIPKYEFTKVDMVLFVFNRTPSAIPSRIDFWMMNGFPTNGIVGHLLRLRRCLESATPPYRLISSATCTNMTEEGDPAQVSICCEVPRQTSRQKIRSASGLSLPLGSCPLTETQQPNPSLSSEEIYILMKSVTDGKW